MGKPTKRRTLLREPVVKEYKISQKKNEFFVPSVTELDLKELTGGQDDLSFYSLVGHTNLDPYAYISLGDPNGFDPLFKLVLITQGQKKPDAAGLVKLEYKNEYKKFPVVEFEFVEPDYRKVQSYLSIDPAESDLDRKPNFYSKRIEKMKYGKKFYIRMGYASSHIQYGPFTIIETDIRFEQGTAICSVKGRLGQNLRDISQIKYYSNTSPFEALNEIANLSGIRFDTKDLLEEELEALRQKMDMSSEDNLGKMFDVFSSRIGVDIFYDPQFNIIKFDTPFKLELLNQGRKPFKMSYGFPSSSIDEIRVKVFKPKKKKRFTRGVIALGQSKRGVKGLVNKQLKIARKLLHGTVRDSDGNIFFLSNLSTTIHTLKDKVDLDKLTFGSLKQLTEQRFSSTDKVKYIVENSGNTVGDKDYYNIYMVVDTGEYLESDTVEGLTKSELESQYLNANDKIVTDVVVTSSQVINNVVVPKFAVSFLRKTTSNKANKQLEQPKLVQNGKILDTISIGGRVLQKVESVNFVDPYFPDKGESIDTASYRGTNAIAFRDMRKRQQEILKQSTDFRAVIINEENRIFALYAYTDKLGQLIQEQEDDDSKQSKDFVPASKPITEEVFIAQSRSNRKSVSKRRELTITLRAGDITMECGRLIEITDVYYEYKGFYYVHAVEHEIGSDGFHTKIVCRVASKKRVNSFVNPNTVQGTRKNKVDEAKQNNVKIVAKKKLTPLDQKKKQEQEKQDNSQQRRILESQRAKQNFIRNQDRRLH